MSDPTGDDLAEAFFHLARVEERNGRAGPARSLLRLRLLPRPARPAARAAAAEARARAAALGRSPLRRRPDPRRRHALALDAASACAAAPPACGTTLRAGARSRRVREARALAAVPLPQAPRHRPELVLRADPRASSGRAARRPRRSSSWRATAIRPTARCRRSTTGCGRALVETLLAGGAEIGLHGSYTAAEDPERLAEEKGRLESLAGPLLGPALPLPPGRPAREPRAARASSAFATTRASASPTGPGSGPASLIPFRPWDLAHDRPLELVEIPLAVMDVTLAEERYLGLPAREAERRLLALVEWAAANGGGFAVLWHTDRFDPATSRGWDRLFLRFLDAVRAHGGACLSAGALAEEARRLASVTGAGSGGTRACRKSSRRFLGLPVLAPVALGVWAAPAGRRRRARALRLAAAAACVLLLPGALVLRALDWPRGVGIALAGSFVWSLVGRLPRTGADVRRGRLALAHDRGPRARLGRCARAGVAGGAGSARRRDSSRMRRSSWPGSCSARSSGGRRRSSSGDALFHLARVAQARRVARSSSSVNVVDEFHDGGLHRRLRASRSGTACSRSSPARRRRPSLVVLHLSALLTPLALVLTYAAGAALFGSWAGGVATAAAEAALSASQRRDRIVRVHRAPGLGGPSPARPGAARARLLLVRGEAGSSSSRSERQPSRSPSCTRPMRLRGAVRCSGSSSHVSSLARRGEADWRRLSSSLLPSPSPPGSSSPGSGPAISGTESFRPAAAERARGLRSTQRRSTSSATFPAWRPRRSRAAEPPPWRRSSPSRPRSSRPARAGPPSCSAARSRCSSSSSPPLLHGRLRPLLALPGPPARPLPAAAVCAGRRGGARRPPASARSAARARAGGRPRGRLSGGDPGRRRRARLAGVARSRGRGCSRPSPGASPPRLGPSRNQCAGSPSQPSCSCFRSPWPAEGRPARPGRPAAR